MYKKKKKLKVSLFGKKRVRLFIEKIETKSIYLCVESL